jgi:hypothetical protein
MICLSRRKIHIIPMIKNQPTSRSESSQQHCISTQAVPGSCISIIYSITRYSVLRPQQVSFSIFIVFCCVTLAERMRGLKVSYTSSRQMSKSGLEEHSFSRATERNVVPLGIFFAMLVYQLVTNFPSIRKDVNRIRDNSVLLSPNKSL